MSLGQGVLLTGLGTFAVVQERFHGKEEVYVVRRPVFQLDRDTLCLQEFMFPSVVIPGEEVMAILPFGNCLQRVGNALSSPIQPIPQELLLLGHSTWNLGWNLGHDHAPPPCRQRQDQASQLQAALTGYLLPTVRGGGLCARDHPLVLFATEGRAMPPLCLQGHRCPVLQR